MKKLFVMLLVVCLLALPVSGCGFHFRFGDVPPDDVDNPGNDVESGDDLDPGEVVNPGEDADPGDEAGTMKILEGQVFYPQTVDDVMAKFQEFGFEWSSGIGEEISSWSFHFLYEGSEEVDGVPAEVYTTTFSEAGETWVEKHWYNSDWECIQVMENGEIEPWPYVSLTNLIGHYVDFVLTAQEVFDEDGCIDSSLYALDEEASGTEGSPVASMEVYVLNSLHFTDVDTYGVAEIDEELFFVKIRLSDDPVYQEVKVTYLVTK